MVDCECRGHRAQGLCCEVAAQPSQSRATEAERSSASTIFELTWAFSRFLFCAYMMMISRLRKNSM